MDLKKKTLAILTSVTMIFVLSGCDVNNNKTNKSLSTTMMDEDMIIDDFPLSGQCTIDIEKPFVRVRSK